MKEVDVVSSRDRCTIRKYALMLRKERRRGLIFLLFLESTFRNLVASPRRSTTRSTLLSSFLVVVALPMPDIILEIPFQYRCLPSESLSKPKKVDSIVRWLARHRYFLVAMDFLVLVALTMSDYQDQDCFSKIAACRHPQKLCQMSNRINRVAPNQEPISDSLECRGKSYPLLLVSSYDNSLIIQMLFDGRLSTHVCS